MTTPSSEFPATRWDEVKQLIVELSCFAGLSVDETAWVVGLSPRTVKREWALALHSRSFPKTTEALQKSA